MPNIEAVYSSKPPLPTYKLYRVLLYRTQQKQESVTRHSDGIQGRQLSIETFTRRSCAGKENGVNFLR
jgi:hypothetical protein